MVVDWEVVEAARLFEFDALVMELDRAWEEMRAVLVQVGGPTQGEMERAEERLVAARRAMGTWRVGSNVARRAMEQAAGEE